MKKVFDFFIWESKWWIAGVLMLGLLTMFYGGGQNTAVQNIGNMDNASRGFRGIQWGDDISQHPELTFFKETKDEESLLNYINNKDNLSIGDAKLEMILYVFYKNKFAQAIMLHDTSQASDVLKLREAFITIFGRPTIEKNEYGNTVWKGKDAFIVWQKIADNLGQYMIGSEKILNEAMADKSKKISDDVKKDMR